MQFFYWVIFLSSHWYSHFCGSKFKCPSCVMKFLLWKFETSLTYTILGSIGAGILITLFVDSQSNPSLNPN